jgi:putative oxidoreductase
MERMREIYSPSLAARPASPALLPSADWPHSFLLLRHERAEAAMKQPPKIDAGLLLLRWVLGVIVLFHGVFKLTHGVAWISDLLQGRGLPGFFAYGVYVAEVVAPILLFAGAYTRLAALTIVFDMLMAIVLAQHKALFTVNDGGGWGIEVEAMILFDALVLALTGGGRYALMTGARRR